MKYLLDTDHISILQNRASQDHAKLSARVAARAWSDMSVCIVSFHEQSLGVHAYLNRAKTAEELARGYGFFDSILATYCAANVLLFDELAIAKADEIRKRRVRLGTMDLRIAATAIVNGLRLVTRNRRDFDKIPELTTEDWLK